jgi:hypothetical protein
MPMSPVASISRERVGTNKLTGDAAVTWVSGPARCMSLASDWVAVSDSQRIFLGER